MTARRLTDEERRLWGAVMATVKPLRAAAVAAKGVAKPPRSPSLAEPPAPSPPPGVPRAVTPAARAGSTRTGEGQRRAPSPPRPSAGAVANTLDGGWDRRLGRGMVAPDASVDLHGHTLASAHAMLDAGLARSIARGDRVLLLVTGKPPHPDSERPHARGAIRAAVADWLGASRHADRIAAVRGAHPRHGGAGALYIVLRRPRMPA